ncbi:unnamed protein product, partial [Allacma fusca]
KHPCRFKSMLGSGQGCKNFSGCIQ